MAAGASGKRLKRGIILLPPPPCSHPALYPTFAGGGDFKSKMHMDVLSIYNEKAQIEAGVGLDEVMTTLSTRGLGYTLADVQKVRSCVNRVCP